LNTFKEKPGEGEEKGEGKAVKHLYRRAKGEILAGLSSVNNLLGKNSKSESE